jgi:peptide methionine sulfoxide reductase MsrB
MEPILLAFRKKGSQKLAGDQKYDLQNKKTESTLAIASAKTDDTGVYKCEADFGGTTVSSNTASIRVYGKDKNNRGIDRLNH